MARSQSRNTSRLCRLSLLSLAILAFFPNQTIAQFPNNPNPNGITQAPQAPSESAPPQIIPPPQTPTSQPAPQDESSEAVQPAPPATSAAPPPVVNQPDPEPTEDASTSAGGVFIPTDTNMPGTPVATSYGLTDAPTIAGVGVPSLIVPDTSNAPFMQKSNLPEGTVFICVGAALGFLGMCVLAWRGLVAWSLQRSVRRAATQQYASEKKTTSQRQYGYPSLYNSENVSLEHLAGSTNAPRTDASKSAAHNRTVSNHRASKISQSGQQRASRTSRHASSLFFSPTAGAGAGVHSTTNRASGYLPPGYYASGASAPAAGNPVTSIGGPTAQGYNRVDSYPGSPPSTAGGTRSHDRTTSRGYDASARQSQDRRSHHRGQSGGSLSVGQPPQGRAPSAYLEDLFENHGNGMKER